MSRDVFVGPLCRFFAADAAEAAARREGVVAWIEDLAASLEGRIESGLEWIEDPAVEPAVFDLGVRGLDALRLLAVYADRPELDLPDALPDPLGLDPNWVEAERADFARSRYGHLVAAAVWLPADFDFTFRCPRPDGEEAAFGSLAALSDQLGFLNARTFQASDEVLDSWCELSGERFVDAARRALANARAAVDLALRERLPLLVGE